MSRTDPQFNLRIPEALRDRVIEAAGENRRSATAEILARLEESFARESANASIANRLEGAKANRPVGQSEAAAVMHQAIQELKTKVAEFQDLVANLPVSEIEAYVIDEPELHLHPLKEKPAPAAEPSRRVRIRRPQD